MGRHVKGEPTRLNLYSLGKVFGDRNEVPNAIASPSTASGVRRCLKAGLLVVSADKATLCLTEKGIAALAPVRGS